VQIAYGEDYPFPAGIHPAGDFWDVDELVSPGTLPNNLTIKNVKLGNAVVRNNLLVSYCSKIMPYRGFGSGIKRAIAKQPNIVFINDVEGELFRVVIPKVILVLFF